MVGFKDGIINAKATEYAVLLGGSTDPGILQQIASVGTNPQVLTSNGSSSKPSMQDAPSIGEWTTFNPTYRGTTTAGTATYILLSGKYLLLGTTCFIAGYMSFTSISGHAGNPAIGSLPYTIKNSTNNNIAFAVQAESWSSTIPVSGVTSIGNDFAVLYASNGNIATFDTSAALTFSGFYEVA